MVKEEILGPLTTLVLFPFPDLMVALSDEQAQVTSKSLPTPVPHGPS